MKTRLLKMLILAIVMMQSAGFFAQTTYVNIPDNGFTSSLWTTSSTTRNTTEVTQPYLCGDGVTRNFKYFQCTTSSNRFNIGRFPNVAAYLEFPEFPNIGEITIINNSTNRDYTLQEWNGTSWVDVGVINVATAGLSTTYSYTSGSPVRLRMITKNTGGDAVLRGLKIVGVAGDPVPPVASSNSPANNATGISPTITEITVTFDKNIQKGTGDISITDGETPQTVLLANCTVNQATLTIPVSGLFALAKTYSLTIPAGAVQNLSGTATENATEFSFSTKTSLSNAAEVTAINFGARQIGASVINTSESTIDVTLMYGTSLKTSSNIAAVTVPEISVSADADVTTLPSDFSVSQDIVVTAEDGTTTKTWTVNFIQSPITPASLPVSFKGTSTSSWRNVVETGYASNMVNAPSSQSVNSVNWYPAQMSQANQFIIVHYAETANLVSFRLRYGQPNRAYEFKVQESTDGENWSDLVVYAYDRAFDNTTDPDPDVPTTSATLGLRSYSLSADSRYVRWIYTDRTATTMYLDDIKIENIIDETVPANTSSSHTTSAMTLVFDEAVKISTHHSGIKINGGSFSNSEFIENSIMCNRDGNVVLTLGLSLAESYTLTIPAGAFKDLSGNELPATIIEFENGVGSKLSTFADNAKDGQITIRQTAKTIQFENMTGEAELFTLTGQKAGISVNKQINVSGFSTGVYLVRYTNIQGIIAATKLIIR